MARLIDTIRFDTTIAEAQQILLHSESDLVILDAAGDRIGTISRRDVDTAAHYGFSRGAVIGHMTVQHQRGQDSDDAPHFLSFLRSRLAPDLWHLLTVAANQAEARGWQLFLVGGAVRDLLLNSQNEFDNLLIEDIDLVVDGGDQAADAGAGVELARSLQAQYPQARLEIHAKFQTAALLWHDDPVFKSLGVDIATARTEFYPYPAANPAVAAGSIQQDLYRRDFTINALAIRLTHSRGDDLLDFFGGRLDLQTKQIRVLHANSFIEDPTRIYRAVRFAVRLGFTIEPQTEQLIRYAIASGIFQQVRVRVSADESAPANPNFRAVTPALQTRLRSELKYVLQTSYWLPALHQLADLGALTCIHSSLKADAHLWRQLRGGETAMRMSNVECRMANGNPLPVWLFRLEILLAHLPPEHRAEAAAGLQLPVETSDRLKKLAAAEDNLSTAFLNPLPSHSVQVLKFYDVPMLVLVAVRSDSTLRKIIWRYLTDWSLIKPPLNGKALKALGYKPGAQFKQILEALMNAKLDGEIRDRAEAEVFLQQNFPLFLKPTE